MLQKDFWLPAFKEVKTSCILYFLQAPPGPGRPLVTTLVTPFDGLDNDADEGDGDDLETAFGFKIAILLKFKPEFSIRHQAPNPLYVGNV